MAHLCSGCRAARVKEHGKAVCGGLIENDLIAALMWAGSGVAAGRFDYRVLEPRRRDLMVGVWLGPRSPLGGARDFGFEGSHRPATFGGAPGECASAVMVRFGEERLAVALGQQTGID